MASISQISLVTRWKYFISLFLLIRMVVSDGITPTYCSSQNMGGSKVADSSIYQSLGNCQTACNGYSFAIVQSQSCWCSNSAPTDQQSLDKCSDTCPGYPYETCGNAASGLYNYLALKKDSTATTAAPTPTPSSNSVSSSPKTTSLIEDVTVFQETLATTSKASMTPITTQSVQTVGGSAVTRTVTLLPTGSSSANSQAPTAKSKMSSGSIIAIAVAVVVAGIVLIAAIIIGVCCWRRKKQRQIHEDDGTGSNLHRNTSVLSKAGLLGTPGSANQSESAEGRPNGAMSERRASRLQVFDQRLNPTAFMQHDDGSRSSFVSMQDNRDYTRTLNVRNPDPAD